MKPGIKSYEICLGNIMTEGRHELSIFILKFNRKLPINPKLMPPGQNTCKDTGIYVICSQPVPNSCPQAKTLVKTQAFM